MAARWSPVNTKLMLDRHDIDFVDIQKIRRAPIGSKFRLVDLKSYSSWIIVALWPIIDRTNDAVASRKLRRDGLA